jgi:ubiquinone biosynthesis protein Coq4
MGRDVTLRESFDEYHRKNSRIVSDTEISNNSQIFFKCHDIAHVIFECDTSLRGEGIVKLWTIFGTTLGFVNHVKEYAEENVFELFREYSLKHILANVPKVIVVALVVITRAHKMKKK